MRFYGLSCLLLAVVLMFAATASADVYDHAGQVGIDALKITIGARQAAMGGASVGLTDGINTFSTNPAGLALMNHRTLSVHYAKWLESTSHNFASFGMPWGKGSIGFGMLYFDQGSVRETNAFGIYTGESKGASDFAFSAGYGYPLGKGFYLGATGRALFQRLADENYSHIFIDMGLLKRLGRTFALGLSLQNVRLGTEPGDLLIKSVDDEDTDIAPTRARFGLGWNAYDGSNFDFNIAADAIAMMPFASNGVRFGGGGEAILFDTVALRAGYQAGEEKGALGVGMGLMMGDFKFDYAYGDYEDIDDTHRVSATMTFGSMARKDTDGDGIPDDRDLCVNEPEDLDGYEDQDGCPDLDNDNDGIYDVDDTCPNQPEYYNGFEDQDGCPDAEGVAKTDTVYIKTGGSDQGGQLVPDCDDDRGYSYLFAGYDYIPPILFDLDRDEIRPESREALERIAQVIQECCLNMGDKVEVRGHADERGSEEYNLDLSTRRATAVKQYMVTNFNIPESSLEVVGAGESEPVMKNPTECNYQINRRVVFRCIPQGSE